MAARRRRLSVNVVAGVERLGDSYELEFEWIGPTRERLTYPDSGGALSVPVALSELCLPRRAVGGGAPPPPFDVTVHVARLAALGGDDVSGVPIELSHRLDDDDDDKAAAVAIPHHGGHNDDDVPDERRAHRAARRLPAHRRPITLASAAGGARTAGFPLSLPAVGTHVLAACTSMPAGFGHAALLVGGAPMVSATVCTATKLGKSTAAWSAAPLTASLQEAITPTLKHATYKDGDEAVVTCATR